MPKVIIDPVKQAEQFKKDLDAMNVGKDPAAKIVQLRMLPKNFKLNAPNYIRNEWMAILDETQSLADTLDPPFWANVVDGVMRSAHKGIQDTIVVLKPDDLTRLELQIDEIGKGYIRVSRIAQVIKEPVELPLDSALTTRWNPGKQCHEVIRAADRMFMKGDFQSKQAAAEWIADHNKKVAA